MEPYTFTDGTSPLLISVPHVGTHIPDDLKARMTDLADETPDTDWHVDRLYDFAPAMGAAMLVASHSRFVIDLNRPADDASLYPGQDVEGLCPLKSGDYREVYQAGQEPSAAEIDQRRQTYWQPYHDRLAEALAAIKERHGFALLWDAHSIKSEIPRFFDGKLWDLNLGTGGGKTCDDDLSARIMEVADEAAGFTSILNGRFVGGFITRNYGRPADDIHAIQLELSWATYMDETPPYGYREDLAASIRPVLQRFVQTMLAFRA